MADAKGAIFSGYFMCNGWKKKKLFGAMIIVAIGVALSSCASQNKPSYLVSFDQDVSILAIDDEVKEIKKGESVALSAEPMTISREDHKTVLLIPLPQESGTIHVKLPHEDEAASDKDDKAATPNQIAQSIIEIQNLLMEERADEALARIQTMREHYPSFSYIGFLEASCFVMKRDYVKARDVAERTLKEFPNDKSGRLFIDQLNSKNPSSEKK